MSLSYNICYIIHTTALNLFYNRNMINIHLPIVLMTSIISSGEVCNPQFCFLDSIYINEITPPRIKKKIVAKWGRKDKMFPGYTFILSQRKMMQGFKD